MRRVWLIFFATALVAICLPVLFMRLPPRGRNGVMNVTGWDFASFGPISLASGWTYARTAAFIGASHETATLNGSLQPGVYRIRLLSSAGAGPLGVYLGGASDFRLYAGHTLLASAAAAGTTPLVNAASFRPSAGLTVLTLDVLGNGFFSRPPLLGRIAQIARTSILALVSQAILLGGFLVLGLYQFSVFAWRREDRSTLFLGLVCSGVALRTGLSGAHLASLLLPGFSLAWQARMALLSGYGTLAAGVCFLGSAFPGQVSGIKRQAALAISLVMGAISLFLPAAALGFAEGGFRWVLVAYFLLFAIVTMRATRQHSAGASLLLIGLGAFAAAALHDMLGAAIGLPPLQLAPIGLAVLVGTQALWLAQRTSLQLHHEVVLSRENAVLLATAKQQVEDLRASRSLLLRREENVRRQIAEMLHSRVQSRLLLIWHRLGDAEEWLDSMPEKARELLKGARADLDEVREKDIRDASHRLHPSVIDVGLLPALRTLGASYQSRFAVEVRADQSLVSLDRVVHSQLPYDFRLCVYRTAEEALQNADRHTSAKRVLIHLRVHDERLRMRVRDDGEGFDPQTLVPGLGLRSVAARVAARDGTWRIASVRGRGTTLEIDVPIESTKTVSGGEDIGSRPTGNPRRG